MTFGSGQTKRDPYIGKKFKELDAKDIAKTRTLLERSLSNLVEIENAIIDDANT